MRWNGTMECLLIDLVYIRKHWFVPFSWYLFPFSLPLLSLAMMRDLSKMAWRAGATTGLNCSLCQAGTFQTGSGEALHAVDWYDGMSAHRSRMHSEILVRPHFLGISLPFALSRSDVRPEQDGLASRRDYRAQLQPVPGGDLPDWSR